MTTVEVAREAGRIAATVSGSGPLVVCVPGMGESQASFRHVVPGLVAAGHRVAVMDLRGHGESSTTFEAYDDPATAGDILALIDQLDDGPATVIGNSMGAAAAVLASAWRPEAVDRLVLIGPFVRDHGSAMGRMAMRLLLARPWGAAMWRRYFSSLFGAQRPADHDEHVTRAAALLERPGRWKAFQATTRTSHAPAEAVLGQVSVPSLVVMGDKDPDFGDPESEARWVAEAVRGEVQMVPGAGHYPQAEQAEATLAVVLPFLTQESNHG